MKVYALVGKSGTGKSYQAINLCREMKIQAIIDDGLLIGKGTVLAGISAKRQSTKIGAIRTALFTKEEHCEEVKAKIKKLNFKSILVLGTSDKMVDQICQRLELPEIEETIYIEEITTEEERETARNQREELGKHVIPVPTMQLRKAFSGYFLDTLKGFRSKGPREVSGEKTVVRPSYSYLGNYIISEKVIERLTEYEAHKLKDVVSVGKISAQTTPEGIEIRMAAVLKKGVPIHDTGLKLQKKVAESVNNMTAFNIDAVNIEVRPR